MDTKISFYDEFKCIADKCPMTCCMQWKIAVDDDTNDRWKMIEADVDGQAKKKLSDFVTFKDSDRVIKLDKSGKCPFLNTEGLCSLVIKHGEQILSDTCDTFPRQIHEFNTRNEYSLASCCPAVVDFMCKNDFKVICTDDKNDNKPEMIESDGIDNPEEYIVDEAKLFNVRDLIIGIISDEDYKLSEAILMAYYVLLDIFDNYDNLPMNLGQLYGKEELCELYERISDMSIEFEDNFIESNEIWLDMVENYRKQGLYKEYIDDISKLAERLEDDADYDVLQNQYLDFQNDMLEYENLIRNYLQTEVFSNLYVPETDIESLVVMFEWISMVYVMVRQALFLKMLQMAQNGKKIRLNYDIIRDVIVVVSRMTGYDEDDIYEYMENSFENVIWQWGYMALIIGIGGNV